jgi:nucleoside-diphosphate-sugar epimerase
LSRRVAVTGARGFIGSHLVDHLAARGDLVISAVVRATTDVRALTETFQGADTVVNLAGVVSSARDDDYVHGNVDTTRVVAAAAAAAGAQLIHVSSLAAAGPAPAASPRGEEDAAAPITTYGRTKLEGEHVIAATSGLRWTILRPGVVYGPRDHALQPLFRFATLGFLPLVGARDTAYTFVYIEDMVRAIVAAIDASLDHETFFVGHPRPVVVGDLLNQIRSATGGRARIIPIPAPLLYAAAIGGELAGTLSGRPAAINRRRYAEMMSEGFVCRVDRLRKRLGVTPRVDLAEGIARAAEWYRAAPLQERKSRAGR